METNKDKLDQVLEAMQALQSDVAALRQAVAGGQGVPGLAQVVEAHGRAIADLRESRAKDRGFFAALAMLAAYFARFLPK